MTVVHDSRALWFAGPSRIALRDEAVSAPGPGEVTVDAVVSLVSAGTELHVYRGEVADAAEVTLPTTAGMFPFPLKFGYQVVGRVAEAGPETTVEPGQLVFVAHPHQSRFTVDEFAVTPAGRRRLVTPVPDGIDARRAVLSNLMAVALTGLLDVPVRIGDVVVVSGLGIVGTFAAHLARSTAGRLVLVDPIESRRTAAAWIGADAVVHPDDAAAAIDRFSDGRGADVYFEASGAPAALQAALRQSGQEATVVVLSYYGRQTVPLALSPEFHLRRQRLVSSMVGAVGSGLQPRWDRERRTATAFECLRRVDPDRLITHTFELEDAAQAYRLLADEPGSTLGVVLTYP